eukprot:403343271
MQDHIQDVKPSKYQKQFLLYLSIGITSFICLQTSLVGEVCFKKDLPKITTYLDGFLNYMSFDIDPEGNFVIGGSIFTTNAMSTCAYNEAPYLEYLSPFGLQKWNMKINLEFGCSVGSLKIWPGTTQAVAAMNSQNNDATFSIFDYTKGSLIKIFKRKGSSIGSLDVRTNALAISTQGILHYAMSQNKLSFLLTINLKTYQFVQTKTHNNNDHIYNIRIGTFGNITFTMSQYDYKHMTSILTGSDIVKTQAKSFILSDPSVSSATPKDFDVYLDSTYYGFLTCFNDVVSGGVVITRNQALKSDYSSGTNNQLEIAGNFKCNNIQFTGNENEIFIFMTEKTAAVQIPVLAFISLTNSSIIINRITALQQPTDNTFYFSQSILTTYGTWQTKRFYTVGTTQQMGSWSNNLPSGFVYGSNDLETCQTSQNIDSEGPITISSLSVTPLNADINEQNSEIINAFQTEDFEFLFPNQFQVTYPCNLNSQQYQVESNPIPNLNYYVNAVEEVLEIKISDLILSSTPNNLQCDDLKVYLYVESDYDFQIFTTDLSLGKYLYSVYTTNSNAANIYSITFFEKINNDQYFIRSFTLDIQPEGTSQCNNAKFNGVPLQPIQRTYILGDPQQIVYYPDNTINMSECETFSRFDGDIDNFYEDELIQPQDSQQLLNILSTTNSDLRGTYTYFIKSYIKTTALMETQQFILTVLDPCSQANISNFVFPPVNYDVYANIQYGLGLSSWTHNMAFSCPALTFTFVNSSGQNITSQVTAAKLLNSEKLFLIDNTTPINLGMNYLIIRASILVSGQIVAYKDSSAIINITANCNQPEFYIDEIVPVSQIYTIGDPVMEFYFPSIKALTPYCGTSVYTATIGGQQISTYPFMLSTTADLQARKIKVQTNNLSRADTYTLLISGTLPNQQFKTFNITLIIEDPCNKITFTGETIPELVYDYFNPTTFSLPLFKDSEDVPLPGICQQQIFTLCDQLAMEPAEHVYNFDYILGDPLSFYDLDPFSLNNNLCSTTEIEYSFQIFYSSKPDVFKQLISIDFSVSDLKILVGISESFDEGILGKQKIKVFGNTTTYNSTIISNYTVVNINVIRGCKTPEITQSANLESKQFKFKIGDPILTIPFNYWEIASTECGKVGSYQLEPQEWLSESYPTIQFSISSKDEAKIYFYSQDKNIKGIFAISLKANLNGNVIFQETFHVEVNNCETTSLTPAQQKSLYYYTLGSEQLQAKNSPPYFVSSLIELKIYYDSAFQYYLPEIKDNENDLFVITLVNTPSFIKLQNNFIDIAPNSVKDVGNYTFQVILRDNNPNSMQNSYSLNVIITEALSEVQLQSSESGQYLQMSETEFQLNGVTIKKKKLTGKLTAQVSGIDQFGEVTIKFNSDLFKIMNTDPMIYFNALRFYLNQYEGDTKYLNTQNQNTSNSKKRNLNEKRQLQQLELNKSSNWNITKFEDNLIRVKVKFPNPLEISNRIEYDRMDIKFSERYFFVSDDMTKVIAQNYDINTEVPPQLPDDAATRALQALAAGASSAITGAISTNILLSLVMGLSLKKLWMLIQTLQIIVHLPLLQIPLPSNVLLAMKAIIDVSNLNIIPKEYINKVLSFVTPETNGTTKENFKQMDIFQNKIKLFLMQFLTYNTIRFYLWIADIFNWTFLQKNGLLEETL